MVFWYVFDEVLSRWEVSTIWDEGLAHCAIPAASADRGKHVISARDIRHVNRG